MIAIPVFFVTGLVLRGRGCRLGSRGRGLLGLVVAGLRGGEFLQLTLVQEEAAASGALVDHDTVPLIGTH